MNCCAASVDVAAVEVVGLHQSSVKATHTVHAPTPQRQEEKFVHGYNVGIQHAMITR